MSKPVKKVYLPAGLIVSMYNLYGGKGNKDDVLSMFDVNLMCSFLEFYFNYTEVDKKKYIYRFYTVPHFYTSKAREAYDEQLLKRDRALRDKYAERISDDIGNNLNIVTTKLTNQKMSLLKNYMLLASKELDPGFSASRQLPNNPLEMGVQLGSQQFRLGELYSKGVFNTSISYDMSTFYKLNDKNARGSMGELQFGASDKEMRSFVSDYFLSNSYKAIEQIEGNDVPEHFAPDVDTFMYCFNKAVRCFSSLGFENVNRQYIEDINSAANNMVDIEITF